MRASLRWLILGTSFIVFAVLASCGQDGQLDESTEPDASVASREDAAVELPDSPEAMRVLSALRSQCVPSAPETLGQADGGRVEGDGGDGIARLAQAAALGLPASAQAPRTHPYFPEEQAQRLTKTAEGFAPDATRVAIVHPHDRAAATRMSLADGSMRLRITREGASTSVGEHAAGYLVYRGDHDGSADVIERPLDVGFEELIAFKERPRRAEVRYGVALEHGVAGLRAVGNTLEFLDEEGTPRLRVSSPELMGADCKRHIAKLVVHGCAVDEDPRGPWGRPVVSPRESHCTLAIDWSEEEVAYPAVLDPTWTLSSGSLSYGASHHRAAKLLDGRVLITGGMGADANTAFTNATLYDPTTDTFAATTPLPTVNPTRPGIGFPHVPGARWGHEMTTLPDGRVLVSEGEASTASSQPRSRSRTASSTTRMEPGPSPSMRCQRGATSTRRRSLGTGKCSSRGGVAMGSKPRIFFWIRARALRRAPHNSSTRRRTNGAALETSRPPATTTRPTA